MSTDNESAAVELLDITKRRMAARKKTADKIRKFGRFLIGTTFVLVLMIVIAQPSNETQSSPSDTGLWLVGAGLVFVCSIVAHVIANAYES